MKRGPISVLCNFGDEAHAFEVDEPAVVHLSSRARTAIVSGVISLEPGSVVIVGRSDLAIPGRGCAEQVPANDSSTEGALDVSNSNLVAAPSE